MAVLIFVVYFFTEWLPIFVIYLTHLWAFYNVHKQQRKRERGSETTEAGQSNIHTSTLEQTLPFTRDEAEFHMNILAPLNSNQTPETRSRSAADLPAGQNASWLNHTDSQGFGGELSSRDPKSPQQMTGSGMTRSELVSAAGANQTSIVADVSKNN